MRTILFLISILIVSQAFSQEKYEFNQYYKPDTKYTQVQNSNSDIKLTFEASKEVLKELENQGIENPQLTNEYRNSKGVITTGPLQEDKTYFVTMEIESVESNNPGSVMSEGLIFYGTGEQYEMFTFDSIGGKTDFPDYMENMVIESLQKLFEQVEFPNEMIAIGESFTKKTPLTIPFGQMKLEMVVETIYTLQDVKDGIAIFDVEEEYKMVTEIENNKMFGKGKGKGIVRFSIKDHFMTYYKSESNMDMNMSREGITILMDMDNTVEQIFTIED